MPSSSGSQFRLDERGLHESALRAQVLERCRRTLHHDINNAVQSIHSGLELVSKCIGSPGIARVSPQECVALLQQQFATLRQTLDRMVKDVADPPGDPETFDVSDLTNEALQLLRHERAAGKAKTNIETGVTAHARKINVRTAVLALLLDAIDHAAADGNIEIEVSHKDRQAILAIRSRRSSASAAQTSASPLLRLLKELLAGENAELGIQQSGEIVSTTVHLRSPADRTATHTRTGGPVRVLIADRNRDAADSLAMILQLEGMEAQTTYEGSQLRELLETFAPDVALIDIDLPDCDVYVIAQAARAQRTRRPLLAQVASTDRVKHEAFDAHLLRPVEWPALQALIVRAREGV